MDLNNGYNRNYKCFTFSAKKELEELTEIPNKIRFFVEAAPNTRILKLVNLQKFYDDVKPLKGNKFIVTDNNGNKFQIR